MLFLKEIISAKKNPCRPPMGTVKNNLVKLTSLILFFFLLGIGLLLSTHKPFWTDELFSQTQSIEKLSYGQILQGHVPEGNNCPLFYLAQKSFAQALNYRFPLSWENREWELAEPHSQIILRILPNIFLSFSIVLLFYFFSMNAGLAAGVFAFALALASPMVWAYWVEARPYGLWILLTTIQSLIFLTMENDPRRECSLWPWLGVTHILLCFNVFFGMLQVGVISLLFWLKGERGFKRYFWITILPILIGLFYFLQAPRYQFHLSNPWPLIFMNIPWERWIIFIAYAAFLALYPKHQDEPMDKTIPQILFRPKKYLGLLCLTLLATAFILLVLTLNNAPPTVVFYVTSKYFIYLTPIGVIATTLFVTGLIKLFQNNFWMRANIMVLAFATLLAQILWTASTLITLNIYY